MNDTHDAEARGYIEHKHFKSGTRPWRWDPRERGFSHNKYFGAPNLDLLPKDGLHRVRRPIENQGPTLRCGAYSSAVSNGYLRKLRFHPDWQAKKIGQKQGRNVDNYGSEPRAIMNALRDCGSLFYDLSNIRLDTHGVAKSGDWNSYPDTLDIKAEANRISGYLGVDGAHDYFDDIRWALFNAFDRNSDTGAVVHAFSQWYDEWTQASHAIIQPGYDNAIGWHTYLFIDWCLINGTEYLVAQNSYGTNVGDKGFFYFPREVVNREFAKWGTALKIPTGILTAEMIAEAKKETVLGWIARGIIQAWQALSDKYGSA
jgi:hypothetical protein